MPDWSAGWTVSREEAYALVEPVLTLCQVDLVALWFCVSCWSGFTAGETNWSGRLGHLGISRGVFGSFRGFAAPGQRTAIVEVTGRAAPVHTRRRTGLVGRPEGARPFSKLSDPNSTPDQLTAAQVPALNPLSAVQRRVIFTHSRVEITQKHAPGQVVFPPEYVLSGDCIDWHAKCRKRPIVSLLVEKVICSYRPDW